MDKSSLIAFWGTALVGASIYLFVSDRTIPLPAELGMAFGGVIGYLFGRKNASE